MLRIGPHHNREHQQCDEREGGFSVAIQIECQARVPGVSISSTVATFAKVLAEHAANEPEVVARCAQLAEMPSYVAQQRLDLWEAQLLDARALATKSPAHAAMVAILELGRINLYSEIDDDLTAEYADATVTALEAAGVEVPEGEYDLSDW